MRRFLVAVTACALVAALAAPGVAGRGAPGRPGSPKAGSEPKQFPYGVGANDVTSTSVLLWTGTTASSVTATWSTTKSFSKGTHSRTVRVPAAHDGTVLVAVGKLKPNTTYYYRFTGAGDTSRVGTFRTAPSATTPASLTFTFSGDQDGTPKPGHPSETCSGEVGFRSFDSALGEHGAFYVNLGDTIYSDSECLKKPDSSLAQYRASYKRNLSYASLRALRAAVPFYTQWDDHEVRNDFDADTVPAKLLARGTQAFMEYDGMRAPSKKLGFYRTFHWGSEVQVFILDERSFRTIEANRMDTDQDGTLDCANPVTGQIDLVPTMAQSVRDVFASQFPGVGLDQPVPAQCTADLNAEGRTMLGKAQRARFEKDLKNSSATWKIVFTEDPIQQFFALPYDRWEGYRWERQQVIDFVDDNDIDNVVWLATDIHASLAHTVDDNTDTPGSPSDPPDCSGVQGMCEYTVGPVATNTFAAEINTFLGAPGCTTNCPSDGVRAFLVLLNEDLCATIVTYGYGKVVVDAKKHTLSVFPLVEDGSKVAGNGGANAGFTPDCYDLHLKAS